MRHAGRRRPARLLLVSLLGLAACTEPAPDPLAVERWVIAAPTSEPARLGERDRCAIGDEIRPALGCPRLVKADPIDDARAAPQGAVRRYRTAPRNLRGGLIVRRSYRLEGEAGWTPLPALVVPEVRGEIDVDFPLPEGALAAGRKDQVAATAYLLPPLAQTTETDPVRVPPGAVLEGGFGLDPLSLDIGAPPVHFRLIARAPGSDRTLVDEVVDPATPRAQRWIDYRIDLSDLAGQDVRFITTSRSAAEPGRRYDVEIALPLWSGARILARPDRQRPNVVLISLDTLRADYVGVYGSPLATTPNLDRFAEEGALYENAVAPYPSTTASHISMLTGVYPDVHEVLGPTRTLSTAIKTLAEVLSAHGYQTAAVTEDGMVAAGSGFSRGFGSYREYKSWDPATVDGHVGEVVNDALDWLDRHAGERFFLFLHTYQVHAPYAPPEDYRVFAVEAQAWPGAAPAIRERMEQERSAYAGEVLYTDHEIGRFLAGLEERGLAEDTVVVITSDHGEALGEHGAFGHGWFLSEPVLRIPLIVRAPGAVPAGVRVPGAVSLVDVTPTILDLVGLPVPKLAQGRSLLAAIAEPGAERHRDRVVFSQRGRGKDGWFIVRRGDRKWNFRAGKEPAAFDLAADPGEAEPIRDPAVIAEGRRWLGVFRAANRRARGRLAGPAPTAAPLDVDTQEKLRRLGYIE